MFDWLKKSRNGAARGDDTVWMSDAARLKGLQREADKLIADKRSVVAVAPSLKAFEALIEAFAAHQPMRCGDMFERESLRHALERGQAVAVAMSGALGGEAKPIGAPPADILIYGRNDLRSADDALVSFADSLGANARITFHMSLDDALLQRHGQSLKPLLQRLNMSEDEPIQSPYLSRAVQNMQTK